MIGWVLMLVRARHPRAKTDSQNAPGNGFIYCHLPAQHFSAVLDLLRNESPIYLTYDKNKHLAYISTRLEPVGEGEGDG